MWVVYEWPSSKNLLISRLLPEAARISAHVKDAVDKVCALAPRGTQAFLFHIGATFTERFPLCRAALCDALESSGIAVVNGRAVDISKRRLQNECRSLGLNTAAAARDGDPHELLIVKTNLNYGGDDDRLLTGLQRRRLGLPKVTEEIRGSRGYKVLPRCEIPGKWWADPQLVQERYVSNRENRIFKLYRALDHVAINDMINPNLVKKPSGSIRRLNSFLKIGSAGIEVCSQSSDFPMPMVRDCLALLESLSVGYGALDIALDDSGRWYIIDLNTTPTIPNKPQPDVVEHLRGAFHHGGWRSLKPAIAATTA